VGTPEMKKPLHDCALVYTCRRTALAVPTRVDFTGRNGWTLGVAKGKRGRSSEETGGWRDSQSASQRSRPPSREERGRGGASCGAHTAESPFADCNFPRCPLPGFSMPAAASDRGRLSWTGGCRRRPRSWPA
jgi:hypothetical protein